MATLLPPIAARKLPTGRVARMARSGAACVVDTRSTGVLVMTPIFRCDGLHRLRGEGVEEAQGASAGRRGG